MDFADRMKFSPSAILEMAVAGRIRSRVDRMRMGANPLPGIDTERRDLKSAIYADCAIVRVKRGREGRGLHT